jgi:uncharacterized membrane protein YvbJ
VSNIPCPHCGEEILADAKFCRHCGSSDADGWREEDETDVDDFDYEQFVEENFATGSTNTQTRPVWRLVAVVLLLLFALGYVFLLR